MEFLQKLKTAFLSLHISQQIAIGVLVLALPMAIALGVNALNNSAAAMANKESESSSSQASSSQISSSKVESSSAEESKAPPVVTLLPSSVEDDLEVQIVDAQGALIVGVDFQLTVEGQKNSYKKTWAVNDGFLKLTKLSSGMYNVTISDVEGYEIPVKTVECEVKKKVDYEKVDVSDKITDEKDIDASKEDASMVKPTVTPQPTPVLPTYENKTATVTTIVSEYIYKAIIAQGDFVESQVGYILNKDGTKSKYIAKVEADNKIVGEIKVLPPVAQATMLADSEAWDFTLAKTVSRNKFSVLQVEGANSSPDESSSESVVTPEPTVAPTLEPTPAPTETPSPTPAPTETPSPTPSPTPSSTPSPTPDTSATPEPTATPTPTATPSASPTPTKPSYGDGVKATDIYVNNTAQLNPTILGTLQITDHSVTTKKYTNGWSEDKQSYYDANGNKIKGQANIGGAVYNFDSNGNLVKNIAKGIDVSKYQPRVDWNAVKASGVDYVIIRAGYRGYSTGVMVEDPYFKSHIKGAKAAGLKVGVYFYTQAITTQEAVEEASMVLELVKGYGLEYPIYFDTEATGTAVGRADNLSKSHRTSITKAFCETIRNSGYKVGVYASKSWFYNNLEYSQLTGYDIWLAHYTSATDFKYRYDMWQYTGSGSCPGISGAVDLNWAYKVY